MSDDLNREPSCTSEITRRPSPTTGPSSCGPPGRSFPGASFTSDPPGWATCFAASVFAKATTSTVYAYNHLRYYEAAWAAMNAGLYLTPVNAHSPLDEAEYVVNDCGAQVLIVADSTADIAEELVARTPGRANSAVPRRDAG